MAKKKPLPLTAAEIALAKRFNKWFGGRKTLPLPTDSRGCQFTNKNLGDVADLYLLEHEERITLEGAPVEPDQLMAIVRRYRAQKGAVTAAKKRAKAARKARSRHREAKRLLKSKRREAREAKKAAERARQYQLAL
jgi:hypothetical protein